MSACPICDHPPVKTCPVCGAIMLVYDRCMPPTMSGRTRVLSHRWTCAQSDGHGTRHYVELELPHNEVSYA